MISLDGELPKREEESSWLDLDGDGEVNEFFLPRFGGALLVTDLDGDGVITSGAELMGVGHDNPFAKLQSYDSNGDAVLNRDDPGFYNVMAWTRSGPNAGAPMELRSLDDLGIDFIYALAESTPEGGMATAYVGFDASYGFIASVELETFANVPAIAACAAGNPGGNCADRVIVPNLAWACVNPGAACTNNQGTAGTCRDDSIRGNSFCFCTGGKLSPVFDERWSVALGALMALISGVAAWRAKS